ncbi:MAG: EAL domain-containing protein [Armatimonadota bacterium]|nr:EAL domain-containing protein [Armatimonadota bacterium]
MKGPVRVLIVDDSAADAELMLLELTRAGIAFYSERAVSHEALSTALSTLHWDVVLCDSSLQTLTYGAVLDLIRRNENDIPVIIVSTANGEEAAVSAMRMGAADYVCKGSLARLAPIIEREVSRLEAQRSHQTAEESVAYMTYYDGLTGLPNRTLLSDRFEAAQKSSKQNQKTMAVMFLDVDRFQHVNASMGHAAGDMLLKDVVKRLSTCLGEGDTICRWGGDEFVFLFPDIERAETATKIAQKLLESLHEPFRVESQELFMTASIGITLYPNDGEDLDTLLRNADTAMSHAKEQSHNHYQLYTRVMNARAHERLTMESSLRRAIDRDELVIYYQPQFDLQSRTMIGVEALVRWHHPELGFIYPSQFIPLAEETGLIVPMGRWVLNTACAQAQAWLTAGLPPLRVNVNLSAGQFQDRKLVEWVADALDENGLAPSSLELEITKSIAMQYEGFTLTMLRDLKAMGVQTSIDDFGTGYSTLNCSNQFLFDKLKIDQGFVKGIGQGPGCAAIVTTLITLGRTLNCRVIAAGVETEQQLSVLRDAGCHEVQGYLFSRPVPAEEIPRLMEQDSLCRAPAMSGR